MALHPAAARDDLTHLRLGLPGTRRDLPLTDPSISPNTRYRPPISSAASTRRTSATPLPKLVDVVDQFTVSPKLTRFGAGMATSRRIKPDVLRTFVATGTAVFKFVVTEQAELNEIAALAELHELAPVWVMPEGTDAAVVIARLRVLADPAVRRGYHLSNRLHVLLWGDQRGRGHHHTHLYRSALARHDVVVLNHGVYSKLAYALTEQRPDRAKSELLDQIRACVAPVRLLYQGWVFAMTST